MLICGIVLLYGGLGFCITSAVKAEKRKNKEN
nr:hypothetical protein [Clostridium ganghwense]